LCVDRTEILERALALSQHLTVEFDRLANWLDQVDDELRTAPELTTATPQHQIQEQRGHNSELAAALMAYLPVVEQFRSDVGELKEICVQEDGIKLGELADEIIAKYEDVRKAVETRRRALDSIVDATSGLGERVDNFMQTLQEVFDRLHQNTTFSSDLALLKSQIVDINAIKEGLRYKKSAYTALKESASELLSSVPSADLPSNCVNKKLAQLSDLWCSLEKELEDRADVLDSVLVKVNHFWNELDELQRMIDDLHIKLESVEPAVGQPKQLQQQQLEMQAVASNMTSIENKLSGLREAAAALSGIIHPEEQIVINSQVDAIHDGWETIARLLAAKNRPLLMQFTSVPALSYRDLFVAAEETMSFHRDLTHLLDWLDAFEARLAKFPAMETLKVDEVPRVLTELHAFKDEMDKKAVIKEQLSYTALHIANGAPFHQGAAIRHPLSKLNLRWSQLYAALCERQSKVERLLLQMGRLSEAADQLISWMGKTAEMLRELSVHTAMPRELEIKRYQLSVISSDVHARESSVAALNAASQRLTSDDQNTDVLRKMDEMNKEWKELNKTLQGLTDQLDHAKVEAEKVGREAEQWMIWLDDVESQLTTTRPVGGLPDTAQIQLDDFLVLKAEVAQNVQAIDAYIDGIRGNIGNGDGNSSSWIERNYTLIRNRWARVKVSACFSRVVFFSANMV
uniref:DYST n=1 Tax=Angiostrongylus cantonensis TaxID=6313 RepID=A0A0K0CVV6_ANGCA